jgi:hypothetical protein
MNVALEAAAEMGPCLRPIVESKNAFNFVVQPVGQMDRPSTAAIGAPFIFVPLKIYLEGAVELLDCASENDSPPCGVLLHNREAMRIGELLYSVDIAWVRSELLCEIPALDVLRPAAGAMKLLYLIMQCIGHAMPD